MLIGAFSRATGLTPDTIRFYVKRGLLHPRTSAKGGRNPYQIFTADHVRSARLIRMAQSLGMSLKEIIVINDEHLADGLTRERSMEIMTGQLVRLDAQAATLATMRAYLRAKLVWLEGGEQGPEPDFPGVAD